MRAVVQRALSASVTINGGETRSIGRGLAVFLGVVKGDTEREADVLAGKLSGLRVFSDEADKMNLSLSDAGGQVLLIPNFTLGTDCKKGRRPSFDLASPPDRARELFLYFADRLGELGVPVVTGEFGADMRVPVENDGPVTIILDTEKLGGTT
jgi:D-tyrosyl-tRNA(Tyr) deacylase